jgi:hypothetical protein
VRIMREYIDGGFRTPQVYPRELAEAIAQDAARQVLPDSRQLRSEYAGLLKRLRSSRNGDSGRFSNSAHCPGWLPITSRHTSAR